MSRDRDPVPSIDSRRGLEPSGSGSAFVNLLLSPYLERLGQDVQDLQKMGRGVRIDGKAIAEAALLAYLLSRVLPDDERLTRVGALLGDLVRTPTHRLALIRHPRVANGPTGIAHGVASLLGHPDAEFQRLLDAAERVEPYTGVACLPWIAAQGAWVRRLSGHVAVETPRSSLPYRVDPLLIENEDLFNACHILWFNTDFGFRRIASAENVALIESIEALLIGRVVAGDLARASELMATRLVFEGPATAPLLWGLAALLATAEVSTCVDRHTVYATGIALSMFYGRADVRPWDSLLRLDLPRRCSAALDAVPGGPSAWEALQAGMSRAVERMAFARQTAASDQAALVRDLEDCALAGLFVRAGRAGDFDLLQDCLRVRSAPCGPLRAVQSAAEALIRRLLKHEPIARGARTASQARRPERRVSTEGHNSYVRGIYDRVAARYDDAERGTFTRSAEILVAHAHAHVPVYSAILDVGTGTGAVPAALQGMAGRILGVDLSEEMLNRARCRFAGRQNVRFEAMDATALALPDASFQAVFCSQALPFFQSRRTALREFYRVLAPEGIIAVGVRGPAAPIWQFLSRLVAFFDAAAPILGDPFRSRDWTAELVEDAIHVGFRVISSDQDAFEVYFPSFEDLWEHLWTSGFRATLERIPPLRLDEFRDSARAGVEAMLGTTSVRCRVTAISVIGRKPGDRRGEEGHA